MTDTAQQDAEDLLHWLNAHSVSISDGIPITMIQQKWTATRRNQEQLKACLEWLFRGDLVGMTPHLSPPHVRLSARGFQRLLNETDQGRAVEIPVTSSAPPAAPTFTPAPAVTPFQAAPLAEAAAPAPVATPAAPAEPTPPRRYVDPSQPPSEIGLRNQILSIFRDLKLQAGQQLIAMTLTRYWQEMGQRGEHLRTGIDVLLRDGYLQHTVKRYENYWLLTASGHAYLTASLPPPGLLALAAPLTRLGDGYTDEDLRRKGLALFKKQSTQDFATLEADWRLHRDALIHALDLLCKSGALSMEGERHFRLTGMAAR
jgi:hypothetical protein